MISGILALAERYDCPEHFYIASSSRQILTAAAQAAPGVERCLICNGTDGVTLAQELGCTRIQLEAKDASKAIFRAAKAAKIRCALVVASEDLQVEQWLREGADCILAENYLAVSKLR